MCDLSKAFDIVEHTAPLAQLEHYGIREIVNELLRSHLTERTQTVQCGGLVSHEQSINCGIPQGSILGSVLFVVLVNDLPRNIIAE